MGETELQMCVRHVAEQETRIVRQEALIERVRKFGLPLLEDALRLLDSMHNLLDEMRALRRGFPNFRLTHYRHPVELEHRGVGEIEDPVDTGQVGDDRAAPHIDNDTRRAQALLAYADRIRRDKAGTPLDDRAALHSSEPGLDAGASVRRDGIGPRLYAGHVASQRRVDAVIGTAPGHMSGVGAGDKCFGRHAAGVDASVAEKLPLDQCHGHPSARQPTGEGRTGLPGADNDRVEVPTHCTATTKPGRPSRGLPVRLLPADLAQ